MDDRTDADAIAASLGTPAAFGVIFDRHATVLHRFLVRRLGPDDADGLLGETFRIAFEKRHGYDLDRTNARPWLYGIATNLVARHRRTEARRIVAVARLAGQRLAPDDATERSNEALDATDRWVHVAGAITALPEAERDTLLLHVWEGLAYQEVAEALAVPLGTVRSRINRARARLRELEASSGRQQHVRTAHTDHLEPGKITP